MARMTEEEAWALDDYVTNNEITLGSNGSDWLSIWGLRLKGLSNETVNYLMAKAETDHKSPAEIINEMVGKEIAVSANALASVQSCFIMALMTEEEADALDEELTRTTPRVNPEVRGVTARKGFKMMLVDDFSAEYITSKALATKQSPEEIIHKMIGNEMAVSM